MSDIEEIRRRRMEQLQQQQAAQQVSPQEAMEQSENFTYKNFHFDCIGHAGYKYGPVLIWRIDK